MVFDPCPEQKTQIILKAGAIIRELKGLPEEKNITILYDETAPLLGIIVVPMGSGMVNHLPSPAEMKDDKGNSIVPRKDCPKCGGKMTMPLSSICPSCKDSEGGKYKSGYQCENEGCNFIDEKNGDFLLQRLIKMGVEIPEGMKQAMGIKTITDNGLK